MKVDTDIKHLAIVVALAVLIPFTVRSGIKAYQAMQTEESAMANDHTTLLIAGGIGIACMIIGSQITIQAVAGGIFIGGLVTLIKAIKCSWGDFDALHRFLLLLAGIIIALFFGLRGNMSLKNLMSHFSKKKRPGTK